LRHATLDAAVDVPQGLNASFFHQVDDRWALLGSVGWQEWSKFGQVEVSVDSNDPRSLTQNLHYKDTWHVAGGAQYRLTEPWRLNVGVAYDSAFQDKSNVSPMLPANAAWRFGLGAEKEETKTFFWGLALEYAYGGTLDVNRHADVPTVLGGRGDLVGSYERTGIVFLGANFNWKFQ
jgi:long-chain fatty acid transport protein